MGSKLCVWVQMTDQDTVMILTGNWVREDDGKWVFDSLNEEGTEFFTLKAGLEYDELVDLVKQSLAIASRNVKLKISYQYSSWMLIDDGDGSTPQFISENHEVEVFVQMRRKIEEVNLCVTISQCSDGVTTGNSKPHFANVTDQNVFGGSFGVPVSDIIPYRRNGIDIRENQPISLCRHEHTTEEGETSRPVKRRLFYTDGNAADSELDVGPTQRAAVNSPKLVHETLAVGGESSTGLTQWPQFQDALHQFLDDESSQNVLFNRDALPVVDSVEKDGIEAALEAVPYEGDNLFVGQVFKSKMYPHAQHAACTVHLWRNIKSRFKSKRMASLMGASARAYTVAKFNKKFLDIQRVSQGCASYLVDIAVKHPPGRPRKVKILSTGEDKVFFSYSVTVSFHLTYAVGAGEKATTRPPVVVQYKASHMVGLYQLSSTLHISTSETLYTAATFTSNEDKIRLCYLAALSCGLLGVNCKSAIPQHLAEMVIDLETFEQHPWGYEAVTDLFSMVCRMMWRI
ncbi:unnamed protein product [Brassica oleracea var. botrytis]|uniref:DUF1985 domain-containing protein n=2 Tax=Brassica TaxID=3705 RepID=A0A3P6C6D8_BRAOL|nr:unnamed protein product [Brassica napus]CDY27295.1 BnaC04g18750D [Brassica napus]VDD08724.1 unnamed protein product [Brassica oleracea]